MGRAPKRIFFSEAGQSERFLEKAGSLPSCLFIHLSIQSFGALSFDGATTTVPLYFERNRSRDSRYGADIAASGTLAIATTF